MGLWYGRAKLLENYGDRAGARRCLRRGYCYAVFLHGFYDACAMSGTALATGLFIVFVLLMFASAGLMLALIAGIAALIG